LTRAVSIRTIEGATIVGLTRAAARELGRDGIRVNAIAAWADDECEPQRSRLDAGRDRQSNRGFPVDPTRGNTGRPDRHSCLSGLA
jgi:NAD(P)-dependent dehydrogenase (short-subunit alcohol dehydrogenase family)